MLRTVFFVLFLISLAYKVQLLNNGMARTPPMGWMSWGYYMCGYQCESHPEKCLDEKLILSVADTFYNEGYLEAGYEYIIIDDCWSERRRGKGDELVPDKKRFPRGMKYIADYIHAKGLKFGMYTNVANITCMSYPGSLGHFTIDAKTFANWHVDYLKVDGCFVNAEYLNKAFIDFRYHLNNTGRPMVYSCSWPFYIRFIHRKTEDYEKVAENCNMWRNYFDVENSWASVKKIIKYYEQNANKFAKYHSPGQWNDPDMLIIGTGVLSKSQSRVQLVVYAMLSAPLVLSCDVAKITPYERGLLQNLDLIAIAQDPLGIMAKPYKIESITLWVKTHLPRKGDRYHSTSFAFVNMQKKNKYVSFVPSDYGLNSTGEYTVMDVFTGKFLWNITLGQKIEVHLPPEDVVLYTLYPL